MPFHPMKVRMHLVCNRIDAAKKRELLGAAPPADIHSGDTLSGKEWLMPLVGCDLRTHAEYLGGREGNEALVLAGHSAGQHNHVAIFAGIEQRLLEARSKPENDDEDHRDERDANYGHQRRRAALHNAANVVANRHHLPISLSTCRSIRCL